MANGLPGREGLWLLLAMTKGWGEEGDLSAKKIYTAPREGRQGRQALPWSAKGMGMRP